MITLNTIQNKLSNALKQSGLTQTAIAKKINVSQPTVAHYIKGDKLPALDTLANLCEVLDLDANDILCIHEYAEHKTTNNTYNNYGTHKGDVNF